MRWLWISGGVGLALSAACSESNEGDAPSETPGCRRSRPWARRRPKCAASRRTSRRDQIAKRARPARVGWSWVRCAGNMRSFLRRRCALSGGSVWRRTEMTMIASARWQRRFMGWAALITGACGISEKGDYRFDSEQAAGAGNGAGGASGGTDCAHATETLSGRVLRSGGFRSAASNMISSWRTSYTPDFADDLGGARCARNP